jgi:hypothetical protein
MGQTVTISNSPSAYPLVIGDPSNPVPGVLQNLSTSLYLYVGNDNNVNPNNPADSSSIPPGMYASFDGSTSIYANAAPGQEVPVNVMLGITSAPTSPNVTITGTPIVTISGTVPVSIAATLPVTISGTPSVNVANTPAVTVSGTPTVNVGTVTGSVDIAAVAGNVDVLGVGGYVSSGQFASIINDTSGHAIGTVAQYVTPVENMTTYVSFALAIQAYNTGMGTAGSPLVTRVTINHYADSAGTILLFRDTYWMWLASSLANAALIPLKVAGPLYGGYMTIEIDNWTATGTINVPSIQLYGLGRPLAKATARQMSPVTAGISSSGITVMPQADWTSYSAPWVGSPIGALLTGDDNIIALEVNDSVFPVSTTYWLPFPLHCGKVSVNYSVASALAHAFVLCSAAGLLSGLVVAGTSSQGMLWSVGTAVLSSQINDLAIGNAPLYAVISSTATGPAPSLEIAGDSS